MLAITRAVPTDENILVDLLLAQLAEHDIPTPREAVAAAVRGMLADPNRGFMMVARFEGSPVGVAYVSFNWSLEHGGLTAWLEELYVMPKLRERGLGRAALDAVEAAARAAGCAAIDLEVTAEHARAANLYLRHGWSTLGRARYVKKL